MPEFRNPVELQTRYGARVSAKQVSLGILGMSDSLGHLSTSPQVIDAICDLQLLDRTWHGILALHLALHDPPDLLLHHLRHLADFGVAEVLGFRSKFSNLYETLQ